MTKRIVLQGLVLAILNLCGVIVGFLLLYRIPVVTRIPLQAGFAVVFTIVVSALWTLLASRLAVHESSEMAWSVLASMTWSVVLFVPLHYVMSGYLTSFRNIMIMWFFQLIVNSLALLATRLIPKPLCRS